MKNGNEIDSELACRLLTYATSVLATEGTFMPGER